MEDDIIHCEDCLHCFKNRWSETGYKCCVWGRDDFACDVPLDGYCYRAECKTYPIKTFPTNSEP